MKIGKLNKRIEILKKQVVRDAYGAETVVWVKYLDVWAHIKPTTGNEYLQAEHVNAETTTTITIRCNHNVTVENRVRYFNKVYEINSVIDEDESHILSILTCKELVDHGL